MNVQKGCGKQGTILEDLDATAPLHDEQPTGPISGIGDEDRLGQTADRFPEHNIGRIERCHGYWRRSHESIDKEDEGNDRSQKTGKNIGSNSSSFVN